MTSKEMKIGARLAAQMNKVLVKELRGQSLAFSFQVGSYALSSLIAGFVDAIFSNSHPDKKQEFIEQLIHASQMVLVAKDRIREANPGERH